ncbi:MAG TPA: uracil-DNA glycosylase [Candidatus Latescibacteria bacterium]|nr:uracil-DNA glycosylase [Candidatus Latescibacterota bacterium]HOF61869.1 uracil-DNA glycosylase [Candidatus Latescibacterota bacterium]HOS65297.1 uracil-DNA glycosylase [Candidatus Latescibacterota bacterium]HPK75079.1 uracil-DNA glycosylase [Candidatus Latescibacterota bacterium]
MDPAESRRETLQLLRRFVEERRELGDGFWPRPEGAAIPAKQGTRATPPTAARPPVSAERFLIPEKKPEHETAYHPATEQPAIAGESDLAGRLFASAPEGAVPDAASLEEFRASISECHKCPLGATRTHFVFGSGNPDADLMFVGEAPGEEEDLQGQPFVGRAGQLLTKMIEAMKLRREDVYIANVLKCRPPNNRTPLPSEMEQCKPYLDRQIALIRPKIICALGRVAAQALLNTGEGLNRLRGKFHDYRGVKVLVTYHPAALLRNPQWKPLSWDDLQKIRYELDGTILRPKKA